MLAPGPARCARQGDEGWQLSKDSADAATAPGEGKESGVVVRKRRKSGIKTVTKTLLIFRRGGYQPPKNPDGLQSKGRLIVAPTGHQ